MKAGLLRSWLVQHGCEVGDDKVSAVVSQRLRLADPVDANPARTAAGRTRFALRTPQNGGAHIDAGPRTERPADRGRVKFRSPTRRRTAPGIHHNGQGHLFRFPRIPHERGSGRTF